MQMEDDASKHDAWYLKIMVIPCCHGLANSREVFAMLASLSGNEMNMYCGKMILITHRPIRYLNLSNMTS